MDYQKPAFDFAKDRIPASAPSLADCPGCIWAE